MRLGFGMMRLPRIKGTNTIDLELSYIFTYLMKLVQTDCSF